jgi:hypothetical protein
VAIAAVGFLLLPCSSNVIHVHFLLAVRVVAGSSPFIVYHDSMITLLLQMDVIRKQFNTHYDRVEKTDL